jgi:hypothetical protein
VYALFYAVSLAEWRLTETPYPQALSAVRQARLIAAPDMPLQ